MTKLQEVTDYINNAPALQKEILNALRDIIEEAAPSCQETYKWSRPVYAVKKNFCYLNYSKKHVNLGFFDFEKVDDPKGLLEGTGRQMRHIKLNNTKDIQPELFKSMILQAANF